MNYGRAQAELKEKYPPNNQGMIYNVPNSKKANAKIHGSKIELDEWFVYLVDGEKRYYKKSQRVETLSVHQTATFLGIGRPNQPVHRPNIPTKCLTVELKQAMGIVPLSNAKQLITHKSYMGTCCYCETPLYKAVNYTKEHVVPISRGGKNGSNIKPCCKECNEEKGNYMLHTYIQLLNLLLPNTNGEALKKLQTKIRNANKIAKELGNG